MPRKNKNQQDNDKKLKGEITHDGDAQMSKNEGKTENVKLQKPFLKWVGGKTQIIDDVIKHVPKEMDNYREIFLGGGSVLFAILSLQKEGKLTIKGKIFAYDINEALIHVYKNLQKNSDSLHKKLSEYIREYGSIATNKMEQVKEDNIVASKTGQDDKAYDESKADEESESDKKEDNVEELSTSKKSKRQKTTIPATLEEAKKSKEGYYYWQREQYNKIKNNSSVKCSALFMFLNKTGFRGMYREGPKGFNIPYGNYKKTPEIMDKQTFANIRELIQDVEFVCKDFTDSIANVSTGDFVYLDPPYAPETEKSFVGYTKNGFDSEFHKSLFDNIKKIHSKKVSFAMSNSSVTMVKSAFPESEGFYTEEVKARRAINSKDPGATTTEVIIYNDSNTADD